MNFNLRQQLTRNLANIPGWHTKRKIVVIESDDWGSIRMPSREVFNILLKKGYNIDQNPFNKYDSLASEEDLEALFEVLLSVRDKNNNPAILTANTIVANPDFAKIRQSDYLEYHYEPFTETLKKYSAHSRSFNLWKEGISNSIFRPQFHGREHLNVRRWMKALHANEGHSRIAFDYNMFDLGNNITKNGDSFLETFNFEDETELELHKKVIIDGLKLFDEIFGYSSTTFIAPCYIWSPQINKTLNDYGVKGLQGNWFQLQPLNGTDHSFKRIMHYTGQHNNIAGQYYTTRNVHFEPALERNFDWISDSLKRIRTAFYWGKPAIVNSHRLNYVGYINVQNRERNLSSLASLLKKIVDQWPDVEFMSSDKLGLIFEKH